MVHPRPSPGPGQPRSGNVRRARYAAQERVERSARARYLPILRFCAMLAVVLAIVLGYVTLTANVTSLGYAVAKVDSQRNHLIDQTLRLDDRLGVLTSDARLARIAKKLGMHEPRRFAIVYVQAPNQARQRVAFLSSLFDLLHHAR
ncbi:MAG: hypothetical protein ACYDA5_03380 [Vulcanimicrobiaceae bacterium]